MSNSHIFRRGGSEMLVFQLLFPSLKLGIYECPSPFNEGKWKTSRCSGWSWNLECVKYCSISPDKKECGRQCHSVPLPLSHQPDAFTWILCCHNNNHVTLPFMGDPWVICSYCTKSEERNRLVSRGDINLKGSGIDLGFRMKRALNASFLPSNRATGRHTQSRLPKNSIYR